MTDPPTTSRRFSVPPVAVLGAAAVAQHVLSRRHGQLGPARGLAGGALALVAGGFIAGSVPEFRRAETTVNPVAPDKATFLVTGGPHQLSRNPMYVGMAGLLLAHAVARGNWVAVLPVLGFVAVIDRVQIPAEEAAMAELFGRDYADYAGRVPRWLGF
ncbi:MAG: isoprenylcysteine carboxylmethyltransferase family protein [Propionibacteriales bacterium]|nr:isoprenylcysteine carboxylmethyltransferase family protein [Propionibacteriales bacterium]